MRQLLSSNPLYQICAVASTTQEAIELAANSKPDVIILESELSDENAINIIPTLIGKSNAKVILYTSSRNSSTQDQAVVKGARGVVNKSETVDTVLKAIEKVHSGELWINRNATSRILLQIAQANAPKELSPEEAKLESLTLKEEKVTHAIQMYPEKSLKQISESLHISEHTLRNHLASIYGKLDVRNRMELYVFAVNIRN